MKAKQIIGMILAIFLITGCTQITSKIDDWQYKHRDAVDGGILRGLSKNLGSNVAMSAAPAAENLGFSVGGAKDVNNFRENIENNYLPLPTDITYEGLFYDYYFDTGESSQECKELFCPSYSYAISNDPISEKEDYYLAVGLNSNLEEEDFERKKLNLVIVLDISGSMRSSFNKYYYDQFGNQREIEDFEEGKSKMEIANNAVVALLDHLEDDDKFGMVLFSSDAIVAKPLNLVEETDMGAIKDHILELTPTGGTHMSAGYKEGTNLFEEFIDADKDEYENRIIFLTDAQPNIGELSEEGLLGMTEDNSDNGVFTTFIGIGVDFNTELIEAITKIKGSNYYSVHSEKQFKERMDDEFELMVTPLVFNLELKLDAPGYRIEQVYGSPEADESTGRIMRVNTLFPSRKVEGETRGGIVLLKLKRISDEEELTLTVTYEDRNGEESSSEVEFEIENKEPDFYDNKGIRKAILLARYADLMKDWIIDEREHYDEPFPYKPLVDYEIGIRCPPPIQHFSKWERQSIELQVSNHYTELFEDFIDYFEDEMDEINDKTLQRELDILKELR